MKMSPLIRHSTPRAGIHSRVGPLTLSRVEGSSEYTDRIKAHLHQLPKKGGGAPALPVHPPI